MSDIFVILLLILLNGVFSMSEVALISARRSRLDAEARRGSRAARAAVELADDPDRFLSTVQIGITLIGILTGLFSGAALSVALGDMLTELGLPGHTALVVAKTAIVIIVTYLSIVVGELVPKRLGLNAADTVAKLVARPMRLLSMVAMPAVWLLSRSTNILVKLLGLRGDSNKVTEEEIKSLIREGTDAGEVQMVEQGIMERALVMGDERVSTIMTAKPDLVTMDLSMTSVEVREVISESLHDSYPVYDGDREEAVGVVSLKDLILSVDRPDFSIADVMQPGVFFPESMRVYDALEVLRGKGVHCALVCDEYGSLQGVVTLCDVLEGLIGSISVPTEEPYIVERADGCSCLIAGQCPVDDFLAYFDSGDSYAPSTYTTVAGLVLELLKHIPSSGECADWNGFRFEVVDMDGARIDKLLVTRMQSEEED